MIILQNLNTADYQSEQQSKNLEEPKLLSASTDFESALMEFENLTISSTERKRTDKSLLDTKRLDYNNNKVNKLKIFRWRMNRRNSDVRFSPYEIPKNCLNALWRYHSQKNSSLMKTTKMASHDQQQNVALQRIQLKGCDFRGQKLSVAYSNKKQTSSMAKPCWLQHRQSSNRTKRMPSSTDEDEYDQQGTQDDKGNPDSGLNELSDYFEHFVCLRSPKMSDLAAQIYS